MKKLNQEIDDWFLGKGKKAKKSGGFSLGSSSKHKSTLAGCGLKNLQAAALKHPEVMIKIPRRNKFTNGLSAISNHLSYISRNGQLPLENQDGQKITGKKEIEEVIEAFRRINIPENSHRREALHVVLSMPPGTDEVGLKNAAREFAKEQFSAHQWVMVQHTDTKHPHVHLCVLMRDEMGQYINPRKADLFEWRVRFAEKLREEGIQCAATARKHRGKTQKNENGIVRHIKDSGREPYRHKQQAESLIEALKHNQRPLHPFLKEVMDSRNIVLAEYGKISKELYLRGYKTEASAISKLAKETQYSGYQTKAQERFDVEQQQGYIPQQQDLNKGQETEDEIER